MNPNKIYKIYGKDPMEMVLSLLRSINLVEDMSKIQKKRPLIALKPNLVVPQTSDWGATTTPALVGGVIRYLKENSFDNIAIMESSWIGDCTKKAFAECGYEKLSREFDVPLIDLKDDESVLVNLGDLTINVCKSVLNADYLINIPVLKAHCQTKLTCALKNLKGCIPDSEKRRYHRLGLHKPIALLNKALPAHFTIVDAMNGDLCHEEGGNPVRMDTILSGKDPVLIDSYAAQLLGLSIDEIPYIGMSAKLHVGSSEVLSDTVIELNKNTSPAKIAPSREADRLSHLIVEKEACSACYGSLIRALYRLKGKVNIPKVSIGQGFRGEPGNIGIGDCTDRFDYYVPGCPPKSKEIIDMITKS